MGKCALLIPYYYHYLFKMKARAVTFMMMIIHLHAPTLTHTDKKKFNRLHNEHFPFWIFFFSSLTSPSAKRTNQAHDAGEIRLASQSQTYCLTVVAVSLPASPPLLIVLAIVFAWILSKTSSAGWLAQQVEIQQTYKVWDCQGSRRYTIPPTGESNKNLGVDKGDPLPADLLCVGWMKEGGRTVRGRDVAFFSMVFPFSHCFLLLFGWFLLKSVSEKGRLLDNGE